jgi:TonB family protein
MTEIANTPDKRKGLVGTILFHVLLLLVFFLTGLKITIPRPEYGMLLNFGTSETGSGEVQPDSEGTPQPNENTPEETAAATTAQSETQPDVLTQEETPIAVDAGKEALKPKEEKLKETPKETQTTENQEEKKSEQDEKLSKMLSGAFKKAGGSEGDDANAQGDKGKIFGDKNGNSYTGGAGGSGGDGYSLGSRAALQKIKPAYMCEEYGTVVITIKVNRNGTTMEAKLNLKGTTNTAECLVNQAIAAAKKTRWEPNPSAPELQAGSIVYHFELQ